MPLLLSILFVGALGIIAHYVGEALPRKWFKFDRFPYKQFNFEKSGKLYKFLRVRLWKDKVPDMSKIMKDMLPKKVSFSANSAELYALAKETCVAEAVHGVLGVLFLFIYFFFKNTLGVILSLIAVILNLPFIIIQRYNRPKILSLASRLYERECKKACEF